MGQKPEKILIIDDQYGVRALLTLALNKYDTREAVDGRQALETLKSWEPDLIITDMKMPGLTGLELIDNIKEMNIDSKILLMTAYDDNVPADVTDISGFISKPFDLEKLILLVEEIINNQA
ncbi:MAG: response regulator [Peptococcaceae bacterium]